MTGSRAARSSAPLTATRTFLWDIETAGPAERIATNDKALAYVVIVGPMGATLSDWLLTGTVTFQNNEAQTLTVARADEGLNPLGGSPWWVCSLAVDSVVLASGDAAMMAYQCDWPEGVGDPDGGTNRVTTTWIVDGAPKTATSDLAFFVADAEPCQVDECVDLDELFKGLSSLKGAADALGTACVGEPLPKTFTYSRLVRSEPGT
ncbi:MAG: hypothetical protein FJ137_17670 [Deltaproteobacteria bacterium]|nr:hypothetical protein [Deltaproteobacteria bacterium]